LIGLSTIPARALTINPIYDASITNSGIGAAIQSAFSTAAGFFQNTYNDPITINIMVYWGAGGPFSSNPGGGASYGNYILGYNYPTVYSALTNDARSASDALSISSGTVKSSNPTPFSSWMLPSAEAKALGLGVSYGNSYWTNYPAGGYTGATTNVDGWVSFDSRTNSWFFNQGSPVTNQYDFIGVAEHEISEVLGRTSQLNQTNFFPYSLPFDLFRYKGVNNRSLDGADNGVFFSINNGTNNLHSFNAPGGGDIADWASVTNAPDAYDAFLTLGKVETLSPEDIVALDVIGYNVPEPAIAILVIPAVGVLAIIRRTKAKTG